MLSVLHILSSLNLGGAERITIELAELQRSNDVDAQILSLGARNEFLADDVGVRKIPLILSEPGRGRLRRYLELYKVFTRFDVIHLHSRGAFKFVAPILPFLVGKKIVYTRHGLFPDDSLGLRLLYFVSRPFIDFIAFVTESGREVFMANHDWDPGKLVVVQNGVFVPERPQQNSSRSVRFGSVGRMVPVKGQMLLLEAVARLAETCKHGTQSGPPFELIFFGDGPLESQLRERASQIGDEIVIFRGQEPDIDRIYQEIDVLVVASESEGLSMVIMEAMARGIPAIATDVGGNPTLVHDGETGILVREQTSEALYQAMLKIVQNIALISDLGHSARELIKAEFSLMNTYNSYLDCYTGRKF